MNVTFLILTLIVKIQSAVNKRREFYHQKAETPSTQQSLELSSLKLSMSQLGSHSGFDQTSAILIEG